MLIISDKCIQNKDNENLNKMKTIKLNFLDRIPTEIEVDEDNDLFSATQGNYTVVNNLVIIKYKATRLKKYTH